MNDHSQRAATRHVGIKMAAAEEEFPGDARGLTPSKKEDGKEVSDDAAAAKA